MLLNHIYHGDCLEVFKNNIDAESVDLIFADPPYNLSGEPLEWEEKGFSKVNEKWDMIEPEAYKVFTQKWIEASHKALKPKGTLYACCSKHNLSVVLKNIEDQGFLVNNVITWFKPNSVPSKHRRTFTYSSEFLIYAVKGSGYTFNYEELKEINSDRQKNGDLKAMRDVWLIPFCNGHERIKGPDGKAAHKTQKPEALVERCVVASSNPGDLVVDPFLGSGTTAAVAKKLGRNWIGMDTEEAYIKMSQERLDKIILTETCEQPKQA